MASPCLSPIDFSTTKTSINRTNSGICVKNIVFEVFSDPRNPTISSANRSFRSQLSHPSSPDNKKANTHTNAIDFRHARTEGALRANNSSVWVDVLDNSAMRRIQHVNLIHSLHCKFIGFHRRKFIYFT